jgi:phosphatidylglycerol:prolipoprotein diacylglycerol transferase
MSPWSFEWNLSPVLLLREGWSLRWYTLLYWFELVLGYWVLSRQIRRGRGAEEDAADLAVHLWLGFIVGARLADVVFYDLDRLLADPIWLFRIWTGGLSSHGALLGMLVAIRIFASRRAISELEVCDRLTFTCGVFAVVHRIANFFNAEALGKPTDGSWGVRFPQIERYDSEPFRHPSQLYEALLGVVLLAILLLVDRRLGSEKRPRGVLTAVALLVYFPCRFALEFFKQPEGPGVFGLDMGQWLSLPFIAAGIWLYHHVTKRREVGGWCIPEPMLEQPTK